MNKKYKDNRNIQFFNKIFSPIDDLGLDMTLYEINRERLKGKLHLLYSKYQNKYNNEEVPINLLIPYIEDNILKDLIIINNPKDAEYITTNHIKKMPNLKHLLFDSIISTTNIEKWRVQRVEYTSSFNIYDSLEPIIPVSIKRAKYCSIDLWNKSNDGTYDININDFFLNETQAQLQLALFGLPKEFEKKTNLKIRDAFSNLNFKYGLEYSQDLLNNLKDSYGPLAEAMKNRQNENLSKSEMLGNAIIFTFAGHDTTAHTLTWLIYELSKNQYYQELLHKEIIDFWKSHKNKSIKYNDFKRLPFMTRCIMETLRLWPTLVNGTFREIMFDDYIIGKDNNKVLVPKGTYVQIPNWSRHRSSKLWGDDVHIFNPFRDFKDDEIWDNEVIASYNPNSERFSPFTYGPRDCIGKNFAQIEMRIILLHLLDKYTFTLAKVQKNINEEDIMFNSFTMGPRDPNNIEMNDNTLGLYVNIKKRVKSKL